ncbi:MAG: hypothetical protein H5U06_05555 [Candidatus Aminicenantes bacterium]|nr:hypothetical protein [Candidatus Aminicenantes bacterium]
MSRAGPDNGTVKIIRTNEPTRILQIEEKQKEQKRAERKSCTGRIALTERATILPFLSSFNLGSIFSWERKIPSPSSFLRPITLPINSGFVYYMEKIKAQRHLDFLSRAFYFLATYFRFTV